MSRAVIVGLDGSLESQAAAEWAAREALRRGLPLQLVQAWPDGQVLDLPLTEDPSVREHWEQRVLREAKENLTARHPELTVSTEQVREWVVAALVARSEHAEMLVLGSRGQGAVAGYLLGSVGLQILGRAKSPVIMVRRDAPANSEGTGEVVVGVQDVEESAGPLLDFAFAMAAERKTGLRAVRAWSLPPVFAYSPASIELLDEAGGMEPYQQQLLAEALQPWREKYPDVPVTEQVEIGSASEVLLSAASGAELLVVGRRAHRSAFTTRLGHVAHAALHHAVCPVAVVPHD